MWSRLLKWWLYPYTIDEICRSSSSTTLPWTQIELKTITMSPLKKKRNKFLNQKISTRNKKKIVGERDDRVGGQKPLYIGKEAGRKSFRHVILSQDSWVSVSKNYLWILEFWGTHLRLRLGLKMVREKRLPTKCVLNWYGNLGCIFNPNPNCVTQNLESWDNFQALEPENPRQHVLNMKLFHSWKRAGIFFSPTIFNSNCVPQNLRISG